MNRFSFTRRWLTVICAYFLIYVVWGSTYYFIGVALHYIPTFLLGALCFSIAGIILLTICVLRGENVMRPMLVRRSVLSGIILLFVDMAVIMLAQHYVGSSLVAIVASSTAIWIMLLDIHAWKTNFRSPYKLIGVLTGFVGVGMLYMEQFCSYNGTSSHNEYGILILVAGCISWALGTLYTKYRSADIEEKDAFAGAAWQMISASVMFWICSIVCGDYSQMDFTSVRTEAWLSLLYLIIFGSLLAYSAYVWLLKVRPATEVATHAYVNPVVAVVLGVYLGHEKVTPMQLAGMVIILVSVILVELRTGKKNIGHADK